MLVDRSNWPSHRPWAIAVGLVTLGACVWFTLASQGEADWPGGSSVAGFTFGVLGGLIILFEFALWLRKHVRVWPIGSAQAWLRAHIWLGLLCLPLLVLHSGLRLGGLLSTTLMALLVAVISSGVWGLILQNILPRRRRDELPGETVYAQRECMAARLTAEADRLVNAACGVPVVCAVASTGEADPFPSIVLEGNFPGPLATPSLVAESEPLADFYRDQVAPFLRDGATGSLVHPGQAVRQFQERRRRLPAAAHAIVDALERFCEERRQWDRQVRLHFWLHSWLWMHFPMSVALVVLMLVHAVVALRYW